MFTRRCENCRRAFETPLITKVYCNGSCRTRAAYQRRLKGGQGERMCQNCRRRFWAIRRSNEFCSGKCRQAAYRYRLNRRWAGISYLASIQ